MSKRKSSALSPITIPKSEFYHSFITVFPQNIWNDLTLGFEGGKRKKITPCVTNGVWGDKFFLLIMQNCIVYLQGGDEVQGLKEFC